MTTRRTQAAPGDFSLLETMRLDDGRMPRRERHLMRLAGAAAAFSFTSDRGAVVSALDGAAAARPTGSWRVRLLVSAAGVPSVECSPYRHDPHQVWRVALAAHAVDSTDVFLRHKTTRRGVYDAARATRPDVDDVILWNERGEVTEATIANVVAEIDGARYTPPAAAGLLPGIFREALLEGGQIRERPLSKADLAAAGRLWLINSLREWIPATLVP